MFLFIQVVYIEMPNYGVRLPGTGAYVRFRQPVVDRRRNYPQTYYMAYPGGSKARKARAAATKRWLAGYSSGRPTIGFPMNQVVKMRYHTNFLLSPTNGGAATSYVFRSNSIFDPDATGVGHQPLGHDQWSQFYSTYTVIGSKMMCKMSKDNQAVGGTSNYLAGVLLHDQNTLPTTNVDTLFEQGLSTPVRLGQGNNVTNNVIKVNKKFSAKKFFNISNIKDNQDRIGAPFGSNPPTTGDSFFIVYAAVSVAGGADTTSIDVDVTIDFLVLLSDPVALPGS